MYQKDSAAISELIRAYGPAARNNISDDKSHRARSEESSGDWGTDLSSGKRSAYAQGPEQGSKG